MTDWDALIDEYGPLVVRISWRILGHATDVEDNVQEALGNVTEGFFWVGATQNRDPHNLWKQPRSRMPHF